jgi:hypothetical protein
MAKFLPIRENVYTSNSVTIGFAPLTSYIEYTLPASLRHQVPAK